MPAEEERMRGWGAAGGASGAGCFLPWGPAREVAAAEEEVEVEAAVGAVQAVVAGWAKAAGGVGLAGEGMAAG